MILESIENISTDDLNNFTCGNKDLDVYFKKYALSNNRSGYGKTFVLRKQNSIVGFFTLCSSCIKFEEFPNFEGQKIPKYPIPCVKIARFAISRNLQNKGFGREMLKQALLKILCVSESVGIRLIIVDAKQTAASFYEKYGFMKLKEDKFTYYLLMDSLYKAIKQ